MLAALLCWRCARGVWYHGTFTTYAGAPAVHQQRRTVACRRRVKSYLRESLKSFPKGISLLMVVHNTLELLVGIKALPASPQVRQFSLGISSLSALGIFGSALEVVLILYLWLASVVGFYSLPGFCRLRPQPRSASLTQVIGNCAVLLLLSSALPVISRTLGITNFDLLGDFGRIEWLASFPLVLAYNVVFAVAAATSLATKVTAAMRRELLGRLAAWGKDD